MSHKDGLAQEYKRAIIRHLPNQSILQYYSNESQACFFLPLGSSSPALLSLQQLSVGGDLHIQGHLYIQEVLVLAKVASHVIFHFSNLSLQTSNGVLVTASLAAHPFLHLPHLPYQRLVLDR